MQIRQIIFRGIWLIAILLLAVAGTLSAQPASYTYLHIDYEKGLASNHVLSILQDRKGFLWLGTSNGLQRYDGRQFITFRHHPHNPNSLPSDIILSLYEDASGVLWIVTTLGVTAFTPSSAHFKQVNVKDKVSFGAPERFRLEQDQEGRLWLISHIAKQAFIYAPAQDSFQKAHYSAFSGHLPLYAQYRQQLSAFPSAEPYALLKDHKGVIWAGGDQLLALYPDTAAFTLIPKQKTIRYGIDYNLIFSVAEDREGTIWLGTDQGLYYFNPNKHDFFFPTRKMNFLANPASIGVTGFLETKVGEIWVSTLGAGIQVYDKQFRLRKKYLPEGEREGQATPVWYLVQDKDGIVWAGTQQGLLRIDPAQKETRKIVMPGHTLLKASIDKDGFIWWGTWEGKLLRWDTKANNSVLLKLPENASKWGRIQYILEGKENKLWIATSESGVFCLDKYTGSIIESYTASSNTHRLLSNQTGAMIWYTEHVLAISTQEGLHFVDTEAKTVKAFTTADGLPANALLNVLKDRDGKLLLTTQYSLCRWNMNTEDLVQYGSREGLPNQLYAFSTAYRLKDGRILIGMMQDFYYFYPDSLQEDKAIPPVQIIGMQVYNQSIRLDSALKETRLLQLSHKQNFFTIEFASLTYYDEPRVQYSYQLEGIDAGWVEAGNKRFATYTDLAGGKYLFKVKARANNGLASPQITTLYIQVGQPFWETIWFNGLVLAAILAAGYGLYRMRINRLVGLEKVRSRIARDLHDDMGSTLSTISILSSVARQQVRTHEQKSEEYLEKISTYSQRMMETMDDIVWSVNPVNDSLENLLARMREFGTEILEPKDIIFSLRTDHLSPALHLPTQVRYDCFMVFKEAINNSAKYSGCQHVWVTISSRSKSLHFTIRDDGTGFDTSQVREGNGLTNMQKRIEYLKGTLQVQSETGKGTVITFSIPL